MPCPSEDRARYAAFKAKDTRFDGSFFVGVSSTGIYCRPVCPAKLPKETHCTFYDTAAAAEQAGFRPCLLCRPELAPGSAPMDATSALAREAARLLEEQCGSGQNIAEYARRLGCSDRHLRRAFMDAFHVSPIQYLQTCRLLLAKSLLTDTQLSVTDIALASGFNSLRRFNGLFKAQYRMPPTALRRQISRQKKSPENISVMLGYRPPYQWERLLDFLGQRAIPGVESVSDGTYMRTVRHVTLGEKILHGWLQVAHRPHKNALAVTLNADLLPALPHVLARIRSLFDLYCSPDAVYQTLSAMNGIKPGLCVPGVRLPGCFEPFEMTVRAVLGQQITVKAAGTLAGRIAEAFGAPVETGMNGLTHAFPSAHAIAALGGEISNHLGPLGITRARANTILALARSLVRGEIDLGLCLHPEREIKKLMTIPGIGAWTAHYIAMRAMGWPDAFLHTDLGVKKALAPLSGNEILKTAEDWRPWRSYATVNLWNSLKV